MMKGLKGTRMLRGEKATFWVGTTKSARLPTSVDVISVQLMRGFYCLGLDSLLQG